MPVGVIGGLASGLMGMSSANKAANAQEKAANDQIALARETRDLTRADLAPYVQGGNLGQQAYLNTLGLAATPMVGATAPQITSVPAYGKTPASFSVGGQTFGSMAEAQAYANAHQTGGTAWGGYTQSPGYQNQIRQGMDSLQSSAAAQGGLASGRTMQDAMAFGQGMAQQDFGNFQNRLAALGQSGQAAAGMQANANTNYAEMGTNALGNIGNARAAGAMGVGNAFTDMMGNIVGGIGMQKGMGGKSNSLFPGNSWG